MTRLDVLLAALRSRARRKRSARFLRAAGRTFDIAVVLVPAAVLAARIRPDLLGRATGVLAWSLGAALALPLLVGLAVARGSVPRRRGLARDIDAATGAEERVLTAVEVLDRRIEGPLVPRLVDDAADFAARFPMARREPLILRISMLRAVLAVVLAFILTLMPALPTGALRFPVAGGAAPAPAAGEGRDGRRSAGAAAELGDLVTVAIDPNRSVYLAGEEMLIDFEVTPKAPLAEALRLSLGLRIDTREDVDLPVTIEIPAGSEAPVRVSVPVSALLRERKLWKPGLLTLEGLIAAADEPPVPPGSVRSLPVTVQIAENRERSRARVPAPVSSGRKPRRSGGDARNPGTPKGREGRGGGRGADGGPERLPEARTVPKTVTPILSGDDTVKKEVKVFERESEARPAPAPPAPDWTALWREYQRRAEEEIRRLSLTRDDREVVRRYFDLIRPGP